ncbi:DedA family protein [Aliiroseovarius subalbicans]|uniref:DedA family protein n=1 Tax=Aliiroseovarius subalbicans TaxID=2925840 RepID=UPI001F5A6688|nr:DedA family protein [Aliiroseovarius subalbicans]MCI2398226.1 DedA family protein [Aliiroseovarius subalbicans]
MSETVFALVTSYGVYVIFASAFLSCLALPIPTSLMMLSGGAFVTTGDLTLWQVIAAAYAGAVIGDQAGFAIGRFGGTPLVERIARTPARHAVLERARKLVDRYGGGGVFFSTWLFAPLGPWVNFVAGATGLGWARFALWDILGETVWVSVYVGLGMVFASQVSAVADVMGNVVGFLAALAVAGGAAVWIRGALRQQRERRATAKAAR